MDQKVRNEGSSYTKYLRALSFPPSLSEKECDNPTTGNHLLRFTTGILKANAGHVPTVWDMKGVHKADVHEQ